MAHPHPNTPAASSPTRAAFTDLIDLACERVGGRAILASDDFFAPKENLLRPEAPVFIPGKFTELGKWMDGWESRRKRTPGYDWCIIQLGLPGAIHGFDIDTAHFNGNQPEAATIDAVELAGDHDEDALADPAIGWTPILDRTPLGPAQPHLAQILPAAAGRRFTHLRLNIFPDGGVARLRVYGEVLPDWPAIRAAGEPVDLAAAVNGGLVIAASDMHFGSRHNLIMPGRAANMGDGWETRRRRGLNWHDNRPLESDWCIIRLGHRGDIRKLEVDTNHFKGNFPESCAIDACDLPAAVPTEAAPWRPLLPRTALAADTRHSFERELTPGGPITHIRLRIFPDGGVSRLRIHGLPH